MFVKKQSHMKIHVFYKKLGEQSDFHSVESSQNPGPAGIYFFSSKTFLGLLKKLTYISFLFVPC